MQTNITHTRFIKLLTVLSCLVRITVGRQCYDSVWNCEERIPQISWYDLKGWWYKTPDCDKKLKWICPKSCGVCQDQNSWETYLTYINQLVDDYDSDYSDQDSDDYDSKYDYLYEDQFSNYSDVSQEYIEDYGKDWSPDYGISTDYSGDSEELSVGTGSESSGESIDESSGDSSGESGASIDATIDQIVEEMTENVEIESENSDSIPELDECADFATEAWCFDYSELCHMSIVKINCEVTCKLCKQTSLKPGAPVTVSILDDDSKISKNTFLDQGQCGISQLSSKKSKRSDIQSRVRRVVGGTRAKYGQHPWIAHILVEGYSNCGGSIIAKRWVLTAAHCIVGEDKQYLEVIAGEYHSREKDKYEQKRKVSQLILFPKYRIGSDDHDIGLLKLDRKLIFTKYVQPVCLPALSKPVPIGEFATIMGWGETNKKGAKLLREANVEIWNKKDCENSHNTNDETVITKNMFCAGVKKGGVDSCQGDSGGPLIYENSYTKRSVQLGVVSWGDGCARRNLPGVYVNVARYIRWIGSKTGMELKKSRST